MKERAEKARQLCEKAFRPVRHVRARAGVAADVAADDRIAEEVDRAVVGRQRDARADQRGILREGERCFQTVLCRCSFFPRDKQFR